MHAVRVFSTSLRHARQALYEPYIPPLNQEQKKALRKALIAKMPKFHSRFNRDAEWMLKMHFVRDSTLERRLKTIQRVKEIIQSAFGPGYSVMNRSLSEYSRDCESAPLELAITDESRPLGFPPDQIGTHFPDAYNHEVLARLLQEHGYSGSFIAGDAMRNQLSIDEDTASRMHEVADRGPYPVTYPWPTYTTHPTLHRTYPPVLLVNSVPGTLDTIPFFLSPPVPVYVPLLHLLKAYTSIGAHFRDLITFVFLWTRSIDMAEITPTCVALMVIGWCQQRRLVPSLQNPSDEKDIKQLSERNDGVWFSSAHPVQGQAGSMFSSTLLETGFVMPSMTRFPKKLASMLYDFFSFWGLRGDNSAFISSSQYISVREGIVMSREKSVVKNTRAVLQRDDQEVAEGAAPSLTKQPTMWQTQPIVVQDPFVPSFNHAHMVSKVAGNYFHYWCSLSQRTMSSTHPMGTIFGPKNFRPTRPNSSILGSRSYSAGRVFQEIENMYNASLPPQSILDSRQDTIWHVQKAVHKRFGNDYTVECFGSTRYGVSTSTSDLDLVIIDRKNRNGFRKHIPPKRLPDVYNIWIVAHALLDHGFVDVFVIPKAQVPIVKFRDFKSNVECDLNVNEQLGLWNTKLMAQYCDLAPNLLRPLIMIIKNWAKSHGMNDASGSSGPPSFSSYAIVLMLIGYLQIKGVLPSLQTGLDPLPDDAKQGVFWLKSKTSLSTRCDIRFNSGHNWIPQVQLNVEEAFLGWFKFWAEEYQFSEYVLSIRDGHLIKRSAKQKKTKKKKKKNEKENETQSTANMSTLQIQELRREEDEDAILTAFGGQNEDTDELTEVENDDQEQLDGVDAEEQASIAPITADFSTEGIDEAISESETNQPSKWNDNGLIVADPFVLNKNVCANISGRVLQRFRMECQRCVQMLELGSSLEDLMGNAKSSPRPKPLQTRGAKILRRGTTN